MPNSAYKIIDLIGSSDQSWEQAVKNAVETASESIKHPRVAEVKEMDCTIDENGHVTAYRCKVSLSFKYDRS